MTHVTEQALEEAKQALRAECTEQISALKQELSVQIIEAHNRTAGLTLDDVQSLITDAVSAIPDPTPGLTTADVEALIKAAIDGIPAPTPGITASDVEQMITDALPQEAPEPGLTREDVAELVSGIPVYDDDEIKKRIHRLKVFANGLADHVGTPRMEG